MSETRHRPLRQQRRKWTPGTTSVAFLPQRPEIVANANDGTRSFEATFERAGSTFAQRQFPSYRKASRSDLSPRHPPAALDSPDKETDAKSHASFSPELSYCVSGLGATEAPGRSHSKQQPPGVHVTLPRKQQGTPCLKTPNMYCETLKFALSRSDISSRTAVFGVGNQKMASKNSRGPALTPQKHTFFSFALFILN